MLRERSIYWAVGTVSVLAITWAFVSPPPPPQPDQLPWNIEKAPGDTTRVLGLTIGVSSVFDAEQRFRESAEVAIFRNDDTQLGAEAYFEQINLAGLKARVVATITVPPASLQEMASRGTRISATASGKKIAPHPDDGGRLKRLSISSLTLIPAVRVAEESLVKRFGKPEKVVREVSSGRDHWLYPSHGLDIALAARSGEKHIFQYVLPRDFDALTRPLYTAPAANATSR